MTVSIDKKRKNSKRKKKLGAIVSDIFDNTSVNETAPAVDVCDGVFSDFDHEMDLCIERGLLQFPHDFYIVLFISIPPIYRGQVIRPFYIPRISCPTPECDQSLWRFRKDSGSLEFLWTIPAREICNDIKSGVIIADMSDELMLYATSFLDGSLKKKAMELNNERYDIGYYLTKDEGEDE